MHARRLVLTTLCAVVGVLALASTSALAKLTHPYVSRITGVGNPVAVAVGSGGELYVVDSEGLAVEQFSSSGAPLDFSAKVSYVAGSHLTGTPSGPFVLPHGIAVNDATGDVYVSDGARRVVDVFGASGEYLEQLTGVPAGAPVGGSFRDPTGLTVDQATGDLYV